MQAGKGKRLMLYDCVWEHLLSSRAPTGRWHAGLTF